MTAVTTGAPVMDPSAERTDAEGWPIIPPTQITVHRTSPEDVGDRQVIFALDGVRIGQLMFGGTLTREVAPGPHSLRAYNTLVWKTITFDSPPGSHLHFTCVNRAPRGLFYLIAIFGVAPLFVTLEPGRPGPETERGSPA
jgi:hypothetical protein